MARKATVKTTTENKAANKAVMRTIMVRVTPEEHKAIRVKAAMSESSISEMVRKALGMLIQEKAK